MNWLWRVYQTAIVGLLMAANIHYGWTDNPMAMGAVAVFVAYFFTLLPIATWDTSTGLLRTFRSWRLSPTSDRGRRYRQQVADPSSQQRREPSLW